VDAPLLAVLNDEDRRELLQLARRRKFARGEVVFHEGDPGDTMHLVVRGHVGIRVTTPLGDVATLRILRPGEFFGELALLSPGPRSATAVALDKAETLGIGKGMLDELRTRRPAVDAIITEALANEIRRLAGALTEALYLPAEKRVLRRLLDVSVAFGDGEPIATVPATQEEIAQLAGVTRETANRVLKRHADDQVIALARGKIEILDRAALDRHAR
jgi:CRP-like cAMP-binding protein